MNLVQHADCGGQVLVVGESGCRYFRFACAVCGKGWNTSELPDAATGYPDLAIDMEASGTAFISEQRAAEHAVRNDYEVRNTLTGVKFAAVAYSHKNALSYVIRHLYPRGQRTEQYESGNWSVRLIAEDVGGDCYVLRFST